jgi:YHS domain-containing protein
MPTRRLLLLAALAAPFASVATAGERSVFATGGVAIRGHDPVAYFTEGRPVQGSPEHAVKWKGALWYFASEENRLAFEMDPRRFAPQYGGYCAYAMAHGSLAGSAPEAWAIHEGKLYLLVSPAVRDRWADDMAGNVARANAHWPAALGE